jgi:ubiquinone/menaquinone biosynthesis C-methylase UbiE
MNPPAPPTPEEVWRHYDAIEARLTAPVSERMLELVGLAPGMRVLDIATGRGEPALRAARRVGPAGRVMAIEPAADILAMAREHAARDGLTNIDWQVAPAEAPGDLPEAHFHTATARWGLMYLADPVAALRHVRRALRPDGVLVAALWAEPERVPYFTLPRALLERYQPVPTIDFDAPGTFRFAHLERITRAFEAAGFRIEAVEEMAIPVFEAETADAVIGWARALGLARLVADLPEDTQHAWERDFADALESFRSGGLLRMGGVTRIVTAVPG